MPAAPATQAEIKRAVDAARAAGLAISGFSVAKDGTVTVHAAEFPESIDTASNVLKPTPKQWAKR